MSTLERPPAGTNRSVPPVRVLAISYRVILRQLTSRGRIIALTLLAMVSVVAAFALGQADAELDDAVRLIASLGFAVVVPVVALVFGGAAIGDLRDDKTLVYFWLRPMDRWPVVVGAALAAMTLTAPITLIPLVLASVLTGVGSGIVTGTVIAGIVAVIAYVSVFTLFGVWLKRFIVWGLAYILIWEGFIAQAGPGAARFALRKYTRSILVERTGADLDLADFSLVVGMSCRWSSRSSRSSSPPGGWASGDRLSRPFRFGFQLSGEHAADPVRPPAGLRNSASTSCSRAITSARACADDRRLAAIADRDRPHSSRHVRAEQRHAQSGAIGVGGRVARPSVGRPLRTRPRSRPHPARVRETGMTMDPPAVRKERLIETCAGHSTTPRR